MALQTVGLLHPGEMGAAVGAVLRGQGVRVVWASDGRSEETHARAEDAGLEDVGSVSRVAEADVVFSICPPHAALDVARSLESFDGVYVDANAVSPASATKVAETCAQFVARWICGSPPRERGTTRLYLSGERAEEIAELFAGSVLDARVVSNASALKMAYAAWTKGTAAMLLAIRELAFREGVEAALLAEWDLSQPELRDRFARAARSAEAKGWRWVGEMAEIAATFEAAGLAAGRRRWRRRRPRPSGRGCGAASIARPPRSTASDERQARGADPPGRAPVRPEGLPRHFDRRDRGGARRPEGLALRAHRVEAGPALRDDGRGRARLPRRPRLDPGGAAGDGEDPARAALAPARGRRPARRSDRLRPGMA